jgi:hypothetical protein
LGWSLLTSSGSIKKTFRQWPSAINPNARGLAHKHRANQRPICFLSASLLLLFAAPVSTTYAEPIQGWASLEVLEVLEVLEGILKN